MAQVIDALLVTLGLDAAKFTKGQKEAAAALLKTKAEAERTAKDIEARGKQAGEFFAKIRNQVVALASAYLGLSAAKNFSERMTQLDATLGRVSLNIGISAQELAAWQKVAELTGGSAADMTSSFQKFAGDIAEFGISGKAPLIAFASQIGVSFEALKSANPSEQMLMMSAALSKLSAVDRQRAVQIARDNGYSEQWINTMLAGPDALRKMLVETRKMSEAEGKDAGAAIQRQNAWSRFTFTLNNAFLPILTEITPLIEDILRAMTRWIDQNKGWVTTKIVEYIREFHDWLLKLSDADINKGLNALAIASGVLLTMWAVSVVGGIIGGILGMATAFGTLATALLALGPATAVGASVAWIMDKLHDALGFGNKEGFAPLVGGPSTNAVGRSHADDDAYGNAREHRPAGVNPMPGDADFRVSAAGADLAGLGHSGLGNLIAGGEGGKADYNAVNRGAAGGYAAGMENLVNMTVAEVQKHQAAHDFNAAGRYQIIGSTLSDAVASMGLKGTEKFDASLQDRIFEKFLVGTKRKSIADYISGASGDVLAAQLGAAKEWASIADPTTGKSYYGGVGNNRASISSEQIRRALDEARAMHTASANRDVAPSTNNTSHEVNINGPITVHGAKDADQTAKGLREATRRNFGYANQANYGLA